MKPKVRALLFDMDGLLLDTELLHAQAYAELTAELGVPQTVQTMNRFIGHSHTVVAQWLSDELGVKDDHKELIAREQTIYLRILDETKPRPLPGVQEMLAACETRSLRRALVSSSTRPQVDPTMAVMAAHLGPRRWTEHFDVIATGDRVKQRKPAPDLYLLAVKELELQPQECIAFEDSPAGISAAHAAGCRVVAVPNMYLKGVDVAQGKAAHQFDNLRQAYDALDALLK